MFGRHPFLRRLLLLITFLLAPGVFAQAGTKEVKDISDIRVLVRDAMEGKVHRDVLCYEVFEYAMSSEKIHPLLNNLVADIPGFQQEIRKIITVRARALYNNYDPKEAQALVRAAKYLLPAGDSGAADIESRFLFIRQSLKPSRGSPRLDDTVAPKVSSSPGSSVGVEQLGVDSEVPTSASLEKAQNAIKAGSYEEALKFLSGMDQEVYGGAIAQLVVELVQEVLTRINEAPEKLSPWPLDPSKYGALFDAAQKLYPVLKAKLNLAYEWKVLTAVPRNQIAAARVHFSALVKSRPDPSKKNDELREKIILSSLPSDEAIAFADQRYAELGSRNTFSMFTRARLSLKGFSNAQFPIVFAILLSGSMFVTAYFVNRKELFFELLEKFKVQAASVKEKTRNEKPKFEKRYDDPTTMTDEYSELLAKFGLSDSASEDQIRAAYRRKVKTLHPDSSGSSSEDSETSGDAEPAEDFMQVKEAYDRIIEIRKSWFAGR